MPLKTIELFAGIGGFRLASDELGLETVWANDIEPKAVSVYKSNFGDKEIVAGDIIRIRFKGEITKSDGEFMYDYDVLKKIKK